MQLVVDDREKHVIPYIEMYHNDDISYEVKRLEVGDYAILYKETIILLIERKTWRDLAASLRDGRKSNINKLINARHETSCQIAYLIEGNPCPKASVRYGRIPYKNLRAHLDHLAFRDNVHMIYSTSPKYTAKRLFELCRNIFTAKTLIKKISTGCANENVLTKKQKTCISYQEQLLMCLPSIGSVISTVLAENGVTLKSIFDNKYKECDIARLKYPTGNSLGISKARRILLNRKYLTSTTSNKYQVRILSTIKGVSVNTAKNILENVKFAHIMDGTVDVDIMKNINRGKSKLGMKISTNIIKTLRCNTD